MEFLPDRVLSVLAVSVLALMGLSGSTQIARAQGRAYVANFGSDTVSVIDTSSNTVVATVNVGTQPEAVAVTPDGTKAYVANCGGDVFVIATSNNTVSTKVVVGGCPYDVAITPDGTRAYVVPEDNAESSVWAIDTSRQHGGRQSDRRGHSRCDRHHSGWNTGLCGEHRRLQRGLVD